ncbi:MAG: carboxypeptidase-like regulatory domain-containing protein [Terriglobales bacterium]
MSWSRRLSFRKSFGLAFALLGWSLASLAQDSGQAEITLGAQFRIAGTAVNAISGAPLAQTRVTIYDVKNPNAMRSTVTSEDGRFEFGQLSAGKYSLQGARRGFIAAAYDQHEQYSTAIVTGVGIDTENLALKLNPAAVLSGRVVDESGDPVRKAAVALYREDHTLGVSRVVQINGTQTDDLGAYEFARLSPGNYFVSATAKPWYAVHPPSSGASDPPSEAAHSLDVAYPTTYYPDATDADEAVPIPLKGGDRLPVEIRLSPVAALHLRFHVSENGDQGFAMPMLQRRAFDSQQNAPSDGMQMISPGVYELVGVPAGRYSVRAAGSDGQIAQTDVDLVNDGQELDTTGADPVGSIKASVQVLGQKDLPGQLWLGLSDSRHSVVANQSPDTKGEVHFENIAPGKYSLLAWGSDKAYGVTRVSAQGTAISGNSLTVAPGATLEISVSLATGSANVEGLATRNGKGTAGAMVVLVPEDPEARRELFRRDQSDLDGTFSLRNVVPGTYTIIAIENGWDLDWSQPAVLMQYAKHGQSLKVSAQAHGSVKVPEAVEIQAK